MEPLCLLYMGWGAYFTPEVETLLRKIIDEYIRGRDTGQCAAFVEEDVVYWFSQTEFEQGLTHLLAPTTAMIYLPRMLV